jgi:AcrR family transcriptional regulator
VPVAPTARLTRTERREALLDAATDLLLERGPVGVTMEGVAARAGVTKALPYRHFANADAVLVALVERFHAELATRIVTAVDGADDDVSARMAAAVGAYFDVVEAHGHVIAQLAPNPGIRSAAAERQDADGFVVWLFTERFGVPRSQATAVGDVVLAALNGAVVSWARRRGSRQRLEALATEAAIAVVARSVADSPSHGRTTRHTGR